MDKVIIPIFYPNNSLRFENARVIILDPGHGGKDPGARDPWRSVEEKRVALYLARKVRRILKKEHITVHLTRKADYYLSLEKRCQLAKKFNADIFVSIHLNAAHSSRPKGIETHILPAAGSPITSNPEFLKARDSKTYPGNRHDAANMILGYELQKSVLKHSQGNDRGVRRSRFYVLRNMSCPAALVECGFLSNRAEAEKFIAKSYRDKLARAIAEGILAYVKKVKTAHRLNAKETVKRS